MAARDIAVSGTAGGPPARRLEAASPRYGEKAIKAFLAACAVLSVATTTAIVVSLLGPALGFFGKSLPATSSSRPSGRRPRICSACCRSSWGR